MIQNSQLLDRQWVPQGLQHRNSEKNALRNALAPLVEDSAWNEPEQVLVKGPSGAGKTALTRVTLRRFVDHADGIPATYIDC